MKSNTHIVGGCQVIVIGNYTPSNHNACRIVDPKGISPTVMDNHGCGPCAIIVERKENDN